VERLTRPQSVMHSESIPWTHGMDLEDEITEHDTEVCEDLALDVRMLGELRQDRDDLLLQNQALRQRIRELESQLLRVKD
jgi:hypothetical protein